MRLVQPGPEHIDAALVGDHALGEALGCEVVSGWATFRDRLPASPLGDWGTCFFLDDDELVGWGGFKGPPLDGAVELGYEIAASRQGRGLATAAARAMLEHAFADPRVERVLAHTLPQRSASTRVLEKCGFTFEGDAHVRGMSVWRFAYARP